MKERPKTSNGTSLPKYALWLVAAVLLLILPFLGIGGGPYFIHICILIFTFVIATSGLRTIYLSGQASVAPAAFMGIGAYTSAIMSARLGVSPWATMFLAAIGTMAVAAVVGYVFSRLRATYFSVVTVFFGVGVEALIRALESLTGGRTALVGYPGFGILRIPGVGMIDFASSKIPSYYLLLILAALTLIVLYRMERSRTGMNFAAVAQSPLVASSIGISEVRFRVLAFSVGCFFAGLAGAAYGHYSGVLAPGSYGLMSSIAIVTYLLLGGQKYFFGPVLGVVILVAVPEFFRSTKEYAPFITGGVMLVVIFLIPDGLASLTKPAWLWLRKTTDKGAQ